MEIKKDIIKEHFDLVAKREEVLKMPINSLILIELESIGKSEIEKRLDDKYKGMSLMEFLNSTAIK